MKSVLVRPNPSAIRGPGQPRGRHESGSRRHRSLTLNFLSQQSAHRRKLHLRRAVHGISQETAGPFDREIVTGGRYPDTFQKRGRLTNLKTKKQTWAQNQAAGWWRMVCPENEAGFLQFRISLRFRSARQKPGFLIADASGPEQARRLKTKNNRFRVSGYYNLRRCAIEKRTTGSAASLPWRFCRNRQKRHRRHERDVVGLPAMHSRRQVSVRTKAAARHPLANHIFDRWFTSKPARANQRPLSEKRAILESVISIRRPIQ